MLVSIKSLPPHLILQKLFLFQDKIMPTKSCKFWLVQQLKPLGVQEVWDLNPSSQRVYIYVILKKGILFKGKKEKRKDPPSLSSQKQYHLIQVLYN